MKSMIIFDELPYDGGKMTPYFVRVKEYIYQLGYDIVSEDEAEEIVVINKEEEGISGMVLDCEDPILILEQGIMDVPSSRKEELFQHLLIVNRNLIHGAFVLDADAKKVIFRDTLQLENLDLNELEASISALSLGLAEYAGSFLDFAQ